MGIAEIDQIVAKEYVRAGTPDDAVDGVIPTLVVAPGDADQVARVLRLAGELRLQVVPRGSGTKRCWGNTPKGADIVLSLGRFSRVVEHAWGDMTATVQAGCVIADLQSALAIHGQRLALDPLWPAQATIGGVLATNDSGSLRVRYGGLRDQVIGVTVVLSDGTVAKSGGKVVKNVAGYDLPKLMTGALGTLGVIVEATFRLYPLPLAIYDISVEVPDVQSAGRALLAVNDSTLAPAAVQLRVGSAYTPIIDLRFEGVEAALASQAEQLARVVGMQTQPGDTHVWQAREGLWCHAEQALITKLSLLMSDMPHITALIEAVSMKLRLEWQLVLTSQGVGIVRFDGANEEALLAAVSTIRQELAAFDASLSILNCPLALKQRIDVWGDTGDGLALMRRVKERFDPTGVLNIGRFVGRI